MTTVEAAPRATSTPVPAGRGRWRLLAYQRQFSTALPIIICELTHARSRRLDLAWNTPAQLSFTVDGHDPEAALLLELATDVVAYRWDEPFGGDRPMFRGLIDHSEDQISEQSATVNFTCHDYFGLLGRRTVTQSTPWVITGSDQDSIVYSLLQLAAGSATSGTGTSFMPGSFLPLQWYVCNPDGSGRNVSGVLRDRTYAPGTVIGTAIDQLAKVQGGFDYDVKPQGPSYQYDLLRIFYPQQGVARSDLTFVFGANVANLTRTVSSADYANYVRAIGNKASADPNAPQLFSERWNTDANNVTVNPVGLFQTVNNASDVSIQATLDQRAAGDLAWSGLLTPTYTLGLRPNAYTYGNPNMGDTVPLYVVEGRLNVNTSVRVLGISYAVGDDGQEDVTLTVGRPPVTLAKILSAGQRDIDALARR